ncbi:proline iminopeptidase-family hydrolase [Bacillus shivajii]|uniref:proline iminopeptidase-family hydrolase n=1 Tax=Bacillus shivajii TaxID=1983719 RepID=UPI001CF9F0DC|nr:proline iminopeptidase-family hydrolase [Bacillus shivajii]UCZ51925.1 proline iminopeptidase-family hydrolase [Bacillus shivajii]
MTVTEGFINVTGGKVWYQQHVQEHSKNNTPILILHGGPGSSHYSMQGLSILSKDRPVIFYDQLGCGHSDRPDEKSLWTLDRFVEELALVREALSLGEVHLLGHSWGTTLAAAYALTKPKGVKSIIFSSPCLSAPLWAEDQDRNRKELPQDVQDTLKKCEENGTTNSEEYKKATAEFNKRFVCRLDPKPQILIDGAKYKGRDSYETMWGPSEFHVTGNLKSFDCTNQLNELTIPTLYTCGRFDEATPKTTEYYHRLTPNSQFHVFENSAHIPYLEEEEEYVRIMKDFF